MLLFKHVQSVTEMKCLWNTTLLNIAQKMEMCETASFFPHIACELQEYKILMLYANRAVFQWHFFTSSTLWVGCGKKPWTCLTNNQFLVLSHFSLQGYLEEILFSIWDKVNLLTVFLNFFFSFFHSKDIQWVLAKLFLVSKPQVSELAGTRHSV